MKLEHGVCFKFTQTNKKDEPSYSTSHFKNSMVRIEIWIVPTPLVPASTVHLGRWSYGAVVTIWHTSKSHKQQNFLSQKPLCFFSFHIHITQQKKKPPI